MRRTLSAVVVVVLAVGTAACGGYSGGTIPPATTEVYNITPGASVLIGSGGNAGYGITANTGGAFRLVWSGDQATSGVHRQFWGSVWTLGSFQQVIAGCIGAACPVEPNDIVKQPVAISGGGQRVDFDAQTADGVDGFDVAVTGAAAEPVYFDLVVDGVRDPLLVFFTSSDLSGQIANPAVIPFGLQEP